MRNVKRGHVMHASAALVLGAAPLLGLLERRP
jgi:hypothetical protein